MVTVAELLPFVIDVDQRFEAKADFHQRQISLTAIEIWTRRIYVPQEPKSRKWSFVNM